MNEPLAVCNLTLILATGLVSWQGFRSWELEARLIFDPERILARKEYYRLVTSAFLHADWRHLGLNLISLYLFGNVLELFLGKAEFLLIYFGAVVGGSLLSLYVHRHHEYRAYGASGGVCGIVFAYILLFPGGSISALFFPVAIPGWLYAIGYMLYSFFGLKSARDNIGHDAHLGGAIVGFLIAAALHPRATSGNWKVFLGVLGLSLALLVYLWFNSLFLPLSAFFGRRFRVGHRRAAPPKYKQEARQVDRVLEKIARSGMDSLTAEERALLTDVSGKYQRRGESKKPESGLAI